MVEAIVKYPWFR